MSDILDRGDVIAEIKALLLLLNDLAPAGEWSQHILVRLWNAGQHSRYQMTRRQVRELLQFLRSEQKRIATEENARRYHQLNLLEDRKNA
ncbi:hypothetical protein [Pantanalinema sp. GBBB05]|uniref:hypothetical protein n=1 Tax=Pantanalinema sp. GBBB05 TaxID=2604139 RepID=UPI001E0D19AF|nr:hypothetical protein [Pantanalinema sp. GBBB05]